MSMLVHLLVTAAALWVATQLLSGITVTSYGVLLISAVALGLVNAIVRPVLQFISIPLTVLTLGLFYFVVNGLAFGIAAALVPGFSVAGVVPAIGGAIVVSVVSWVLHLVMPGRSRPKQ